jgi:hypothetical protein
MWAFGLVKTIAADDHIEAFDLDKTSKLGPCGPSWTMDYPKPVGVKFLVI